MSFHHYDSYSQALAKVERGHARDIDDVYAMISLGLIDPGMAKEYFARIEPELFRYPAVDPPSFRREVERVMSRVQAETEYRKGFQCLRLRRGHDFG